MRAGVCWCCWAGVVVRWEIREVGRYADSFQAKSAQVAVLGITMKGGGRKGRVCGWVRCAAQADSSVGYLFTFSSLSMLAFAGKCSAAQRCQDVPRAMIGAVSATSFQRVPLCRHSALPGEPGTSRRDCADRQQCDLELEMTDGVPSAPSAYDNSCTQCGRATVVARTKTSSQCGATWPPGPRSWLGKCTIAARGI